MYISVRTSNASYKKPLSPGVAVNPLMGIPIIYLNLSGDQILDKVLMNII